MEVVVLVMWVVLKMMVLVLVTTTFKSAYSSHF